MCMIMLIWWWWCSSCFRHCYCCCWCTTNKKHRACQAPNFMQMIEIILFNSKIITQNYFHKGYLQLLYNMVIFQFLGVPKFVLRHGAIVFRLLTDDTHEPENVRRIKDRKREIKEVSISGKERACNMEHQRLIYKTGWLHTDHTHTHIMYAFFSICSKFNKKYENNGKTMSYMYKNDNEILIENVHP